MISSAVVLNFKNNRCRVGSEDDSYDNASRSPGMHIKDDDYRRGPNTKGLAVHSGNYRLDPDGTKSRQSSDVKVVPLP